MRYALSPILLLLCLAHKAATRVIGRAPLAVAEGSIEAGDDFRLFRRAGPPPIGIPIPKSAASRNSNTGAELSPLTGKPFMRYTATGSPIENFDPFTGAPLERPTDPVPQEPSQNPPPAPAQELGNSRQRHENAEGSSGQRSPPRSPTGSRDHQPPTPVTHYRKYPSPLPGQGRPDTEPAAPGQGGRAEGAAAAEPKIRLDSVTYGASLGSKPPYRDFGKQPDGQPWVPQGLTQQSLPFRG